MATKVWAALVAVLLAMPATGATADTVIKARQANFKQIGKANKAIVDELKKPAPNLAVVRANAPILDNLSGKLLTWFPRGTGKQAGVKTEAGLAIWQKPANFRGAAVRFRNAARGLRGAAANGDLAKIGPAVAAVGAACKACHESFRIKD